MALQLFVGPWSLFSFLGLYTVGGTPWKWDQPVARTLHRTQTQNKKKIGIVGGWSPIGSTRHCGHQWPIVPTPGDYDDGELG
jgi:hypothetical protein